MSLHFASLSRMALPAARAEGRSTRVGHAPLRATRDAHASLTTPRYVAKFGHGNSKQAKQGKSKEKLLNKKLAAGLTEKPAEDVALKFRFPDPGKLAPPVLQVLPARYAGDAGAAGVDGAASAAGAAGAAAAADRQPRDEDASVAGCLGNALAPPRGEPTRPHACRCRPSEAQEGGVLPREA